MLRKKSSFGYLLATCILASTSGVYAQSITTGANGLNTNVEQVGNQYNITGGTQAGANLFYSLQKLGLSTGEIANFLSNPSVQNVLTRVTGGEASLINGLLQVTGGNSNLFIMNPAGIVFGANASLNVPASFAATTATGIKVGNGWFGINSSVDEVRNLTGNVTGYGFTNTLPSIDPNPSGVILNEGNLNVSAGKSVTLIGGMVVNTGTIATPSGKITIAATTDNKFIKITSEGSVLSFELPIADRQVIGNAPVLKGVDLPNLLTGKTAGTAIVSGTLNADALANGNGGNVNVLAENTKFDGLISARGGTESGNGGFAEVSARQKLSYSGLVDLRAPNGLTGNLLIDPATLVIATVGGDITPAAVVTQWNAANTTLTATSSLTVTDAVAGASAFNLTLDAPTINLNAAITNTGVGALLGTATTVNVGTAGTVQNGVDVAASGATVNLATANYVLTKTVAINKNLTLNGAGAANTTISGGNSVGVLNIGSINPNINVNINNVKISNGATGASFGGGILNFGTTTINNSIFLSNIATFGGAIANLNNGVLTIANSDFTTNRATFGGAVLNNGTATVSNSTFTQNSATTDNGGAVNNNGTATISNSTFTQNSAIKDGGGVYNNGKATINNSSFSTNSATVNGGAISNFDTVTVSNSTFSANVATKNGGAILNSATATISDSTFSANVATKNGGAINNNSKATISNSTFSSNNAQFGGAILNKDTVTINSSTFSTNLASENGGAVNNNGVVEIANSTFSNNAATKDGGAVYNNGVVAIADSIFSKNLALNGGAILNFVTATISNSTFSENSVSSNGGAINNNGVVAIANNTFSKNTAGRNGGAVYSIANSSTVAIANSTFSDNTSARDGGAIYNDGNNSIITVSNSNFSGNKTQNSNADGGAIADNGVNSTLTVANSTFSNNTAARDGGAIESNSFGGTATITNNAFSNNTAGRYGGAIDSFDGTATITNSTFFTNKGLFGGAIYVDTPTTIANNVFSNNSVTKDGGAVYNDTGTATISNSTFSANSAALSGGAIYNNDGPATISSSTFSANSATLEGGAIANKSEITVSNSTFSGNSANTGGAIDSDGIGAILNSTFYGNRAASGGAIEISSTSPSVSTITIANSILIGNTATTAGNEIFKQPADIITFRGANIVGTNGASGISGAFIGSTPITPIGAANTVINTTLANNGGATQTFALVPGSIAINGGGELATTFDQRGFLAIGIRDIGAFEFIPPVPSPVPPKPNIDPNKESRRNDDKEELVLSSLTPIAFLSTDDIEFQRLDRFLIVIVELMNNDGGDFAIDVKDIWKDANISIFDQSANQDVIRLAIHRSIGKFIGNEYIELVDVKFDTKKDKKTILLKVRKIGKALKPAKFLKD